MLVLDAETGPITAPVRDSVPFEYDKDALTTRIDNLIRKVTNMSSTYDACLTGDRLEDEYHPEDAHELLEDYADEHFRQLPDHKEMKEPAASFSLRDHDIRVVHKDGLPHIHVYKRAREGDRKSRDAGADAAVLMPPRLSSHGIIGACATPEQINAAARKRFNQD